MGYAAVIFSFVYWGLIPVYWKLMQEVDAKELLAYRAIGATIVAFALTRWRNEMRDFFREMGSLRGASFQLGSAILLGINWYTFVWAVINDRVLDASLGYYLCPFVTIALSRLILKQRLNTLQWSAIALAAVGVAFQFQGKGSLPLPALVIACSWGSYGLFKNKTRLSAWGSLAAEGTYMSPICLIFLIVAFQTRGIALGSGDVRLDGLLLSTGLVVSIPMFSYGFGARRVSLATLGVLQFLGPTVTLILAVFIYDEPLGFWKMVSFGVIWAGIGIYIASSMRTRNER